MALETKHPVTYDNETFVVKATSVTNEVKKVIVGKDDLILEIFIALMAGGNVLLEGVPGVAKTSIAKTFAMAIDLDFRRIQFVPDLLPSDITGGYVYNQKDGAFAFFGGPIFTNILLIDEINRASPKVQSSLFEAMEEQQVTVEGKTRGLPSPFMVITTENPIDVIGTFPLSESQIDRFMFKLDVGYPSQDEEFEMLKIKRNGPAPCIRKVLTRAEIIDMIGFVDGIHVDDSVLRYVSGLITATRSHDKLLIGASPRASIALLRSARALAALRGRSFVTPDDVVYLAPKVLGHRLILKPEHELEGVTAADVIEEILASMTEAP